MNDYERVARMIRTVRECRQEQPGLEDLAEVAGISRHHLHRLFSTWAGVTPKEFLQCLTHTHARGRLLAGDSVLDAALEVGFSGPGRLHDLCLKLEAATPGEIKTGGGGWTIRAGAADSPFGPVVIGENTRGICALSFYNPDEEGDPTLRIREDWPGAKMVRDDARAAAHADAIFQIPTAPHRGNPLRACVRATAFQLKVWKALLQVPPGSKTTYGELARSINRPTAARAVGNAVGANPIAFLIPCHRVIRESGAIGGYRWGTDRKEVMLLREKVLAARESVGP